MALIKAIRVSNLGCFGPQPAVFQPGPETIIVGPNNAGKSMLLSCVNLIRERLCNADPRWDSPFYSFHSFEDTVNLHNKLSNIEIELELDEGTLRITMNGAEQSVIRFDDRAGRQTTFSLDQGGRFSTSGNDPNPTREMLRSVFGRMWYVGPFRQPVHYTSPIGEAVLSTTQPINPDGSNVASFLMGRWTARDERWADAEKWIRLIDPEISLLKTPVTPGQSVVSLSGVQASNEVNLSLQGTGIQNALGVVASLIFSPPSSTVIIEEPEMHLHSRAQEHVVDMINHAVNDLQKQVIFSTHSWDVILPFCSDVGAGGSDRGSTHVKAQKNSVKMVYLMKSGGNVTISDYDLRDQEFRQVRDFFKGLWG